MNPSDDEAGAEYVEDGDGSDGVDAQRMATAFTEHRIDALAGDVHDGDDRDCTALIARRTCVCGAAPVAYAG